MKKSLYIAFFTILILLKNVSAQNKYGGAFLETGVDARILAMGSTGTAITSSISSVYWNPAGLMLLNGATIHGMHSERFSGIVNWDFLGFGTKIDSATAIGVGFFRMGIDGIPVTRLRNSSLGLGEYYADESGSLTQNVPEVEKLINDAEYALFFSIAKRHNRKLVYGTTIKVIRKKCDKFGAWGVGFDAGALFRYSSHINMGIAIHDLTSTLTAWNNGTKEKVPPSFNAGFSFPFSKSKINFLPVLEISADFEKRGDANLFSTGNADVNIATGIEISYCRHISLRAGYCRDRMTFGAGFHVAKLNIDYGFASHSDLGNTHRVSFEYSIKKLI